MTGFIGVEIRGLTSSALCETSTITYLREALDTLEAEREKKRSGLGSELMDTLIAYKHSDMFKLG